MLGRSNAYLPSDQQHMVPQGYSYVPQSQIMIRQQQQSQIATPLNQVNPSFQLQNQEGLVHHIKSSFGNFSNCDLNHVSNICQCPMLNQEQMRVDDRFNVDSSDEDLTELTNPHLVNLDLALDSTDQNKLNYNNRFNSKYASNERLKFDFKRNPVPFTMQEVVIDGCRVYKKKFNNPSTKRKNTILYCGKCLRPFTKICNLKDHLRIHTGKKPYVCNVCTADFKQKGQLTKHEKIHQQSDENSGQRIRLSYQRSRRYVASQEPDDDDLPSCDNVLKMLNYHTATENIGDIIRKVNEGNIDSDQTISQDEELLIQRQFEKASQVQTKQDELFQSKTTILREEDGSSRVVNQSQ
ncbi:zinc finger and btb domain containing 26 [Stylonychia lemnae]|uniref:Zinc finger and btb domain containing 26 n=1 Tax=Stylonychia lemnae TaxID=5949 RepID=A0A078BAT9_STYLE|nr:zinc finger and btb domain containing 26 [Stylonychia lemnae]|eukprot:CDW91489.1 zinc finger and btb domain containing 26 [Stylonychia lemnae]